MIKAAFLDRDGVINRKAPTEDEYVTRWEELLILPGVAAAVAQLNRAGFHVFVVTNQRSVARGLITRAELESVHEQLCEYLAQKGAKIDGVYYCPHELAPPCSCRKPEPGMLFEAARTHNVDLASSWMIGDSEKDVEAGLRAGCRTVRVTVDGKSTESSADIVATSLLEASYKILERQSHPRAASASQPVGKS